MLTGPPGFAILLVDDEGRVSMRKFIGDIFDDAGCHFARYDCDRTADFFATLAEHIDPSRVDEGYNATR